MVPRLAKRRELWRRCGFAACLLAALMTAGGHWFVLQSIAWARMMVVFSRTDGLALAVQKTFDGQHPCRLCQQIHQGQQEERRQDRNTLRDVREDSHELFCEKRAAIVPSPPTACAVLPFPALDSFSDFRDPPPTPPPRAQNGTEAVRGLGVGGAGACCRATVARRFSNLRNHADTAVVRSTIGFSVVHPELRVTPSHLPVVAPIVSTRSRA